MKKLPVFLAGLALLSISAGAQVANEGDQDFIETEAARKALETPPVLTEPKPNQITAGNFTYDGIAVELTKVDNPLQLINPGAGPEYGKAEDNLVRDPITGRVSGLKLLSLEF